MSNPMDDEEAVLIPFILTQNHGGEYDNEAFSAGWHLALLDSQLSVANATGLIPPPTPLKNKWKKQADLIAMSYSMVVQTVPSEDPEISYFIFGTPEFFEDSHD